MSRILGIIPARGGSKGIQNKNIIKLNSKPLIQYSIDASKKALESNLLSELIVSTDDLEIMTIAKSLGAKVPFLRPRDISKDNSKSIDLILHAIEFFRNKNTYFDYVILLQPTSPLRTFIDIRNSIDKIISMQADSLISVYLEDHVNDLVSYYKKDDIGIPLNNLHNKGTRRQQNKKMYVRNGAIYITKVEYLLKTKNIISENPVLYEMSKIKSIDINSIDDLFIAESLLKYIFKIEV